MPKQTLAVLPESFTIHSLDPEAGIPNAVIKAPIYFIGKTEDELSVVLPSHISVDAIESDSHWHALELIGPLHLSMVGIMAHIGKVLADVKISIFVVSTFDTDFFLIKSNKLQDALNALTKAGYTVNQ
jgi:hypothetical protein